MMMKCNSTTQDRYFNSRLYESLRIDFSCVMSKSQSGKRNSNYGTMWICNNDLKKSTRIPKTERIPDGWIKGRNKWKKNNKFIPIDISCRQCNNKFKQSTKQNIFCSRKCHNRYKFENAKMIYIEKSGKIKEIKIQNRNAYIKSGWSQL